MSNIFKQFRDYQSRNVDHPSYEPLKQGILIRDSEELKRKKRNEYARIYYMRNKEKIREQQRGYRLKKKTEGYHSDKIIWIQKKIYDYLLAQHNRWEDLARWTEIARALRINENSVYTAVSKLTKKWYLWRWAYWRYLLLKFPAWEKHEKKVTVENIESTRQVLEWRWYLDELANKISAELITQNKELYEENKKLKEQLQKIKEILEWFKSNNE